MYYWSHDGEWDADDYLEDFGELMSESAKWQNMYLVGKDFYDGLARMVKIEE